MSVVFIGMETSGQLRRRFQAYGHFTISADILPAEDGSQYPESQNGKASGGHIQDDVHAVLDYLWRKRLWPDLAIFHPDCTWLTNSAAWAFNDPDFQRYPGVGYHQRVKPETLTGLARREARERELDGIRRIISLPIKRKVIENPVGAISSTIRKPSQIIQPYEFGDDASKATCLWFIGKDGEELPDMALPIDPANRVLGRLVPRSKAMGKSDIERGNVGHQFIERWANQTDTGQNRLSPGEERWKDRSRTYSGIADAMAAHWNALISCEGSAS